MKEKKSLEYYGINNCEMSEEEQMIITTESKKCTLEKIMTTDTIRQGITMLPVAIENDVIEYEKGTVIKVINQDGSISLIQIDGSECAVILSYDASLKCIIFTRDYPCFDIKVLEECFKGYNVFRDVDLSRVMVSNLNEYGRRILNRNLQRVFSNKECVNAYRCVMRSSHIRDKIIREVALSLIPEGYMIIDGTYQYSNITTFDPRNHNLMFSYIRDDKIIKPYIEQYVESLLVANLEDSNLVPYAKEFAICVLRRKTIDTKDKACIEKFAIYKALASAGKTVNVTLVGDTEKVYKCFSDTAYCKLTTLKGYRQIDLDEVQSIKFKNKILYNRK